MKKETIIALGIIAIFIIGFGIFTYFSNNNSDNLCVYEIPNHLKFDCLNGNETRVINSFQPTIFEYKNAIDSGCSLIEQLDDYGFRESSSSSSSSNNANIHFLIFIL